MKENTQDRSISAPSFKTKAMGQNLRQEESSAHSSSALSIRLTLQQISQRLRTEASYVPTALCSLSLVITGEEPVSPLLESRLDRSSLLTEEEVYAAINIDPKLFSGKRCEVSQLKPIVAEIIKIEKGFLDSLIGVEKELQCICSWNISATDKRFIQGFLKKLNSVIEEQKQFCQHIDECYQRLFPISDIEKAIILAKALEEARKKAIEKEHAEAIAEIQSIVNLEAIKFFLALYAPEKFKRQTQVLLQFIDNIDDWFKIDDWLKKNKEQCEVNRKILPTLADFGYVFGVRMVQILTRRDLPVKEFLKVLNLIDCEQRAAIQKCYKEIEYPVQRTNMLRALKEDGYIRPKTQQTLQNTYFNPNAKNTLIQFLMDPENATQSRVFRQFIVQYGAAAHLQFFLDIYALLQKKPWHVTDLQLLAPYFSKANILGLEHKVFISIQQALYNDDANEPEKIKQIFTQLIPAIQTVGDVLSEMLKAFLARPSSADQIDSVIELATVVPPMPHSESDIQIRNTVARELFRRELNKQITLLKEADIFHDACFVGLMSRICLERLEPFLATEMDEHRFLSCYAKLLLEIPYYLLKILPGNFTKEKIKKQTILSYTFCDGLGFEKTGVYVPSLTDCLTEKYSIYESTQREFLTEIERSASVFELFNRVKARSDPTLYAKLKEEIQELNRTNASVLDIGQQNLVAKTPAVTSRFIAKDKPKPSSPGPATPSTTATPYVSSKITKMTVADPATPLSSASVVTPPQQIETCSTPQRTTSGRIPPASATPTGFTTFIGCVKDRWSIKRYKKAQGSPLVPQEESLPCNVIHAYDKLETEKLIFIAEKDVQQKQWTVAAYQHEKEYVDEMVSVMAEAVKKLKANSNKEDPMDGLTSLEAKATVQPRIILDIAISVDKSAGEEESLRLIETFVGAALIQEFVPRVKLNEQPLEPEELHDKLLQRNKELADKYHPILQIAKRESHKMSSDRNVFLSSRSGKSARQVLFEGDTANTQRRLKPTTLVF